MAIVGSPPPKAVVPTRRNSRAVSISRGWDIAANLAGWARSPSASDVPCFLPRRVRRRRPLLGPLPDPIQKRVVPEHAVLWLQNPVTLVGKLQQLGWDFLK